MARALLAAETVNETLQRVVDLAVETVEGCDNCGVSVVQRGGQITTPAATSDGVAQCDALQYEFGEGPCVSAIWEQQTFESEDLAQEQRWPNWAPRAVELGANSLVSFRLFVKKDTLGALNLYAGKPRAFDDVDRAVGAILAAHGAVALSGAQRQERLEGAIVVAKATGMLMERRGITSDQAMELLQRAAIRTDTKLQRVAEQFLGRQAPQTEKTHGQGQRTQHRP
ncbi:MAG: GAF and ANTAR domain-containing protein [Actinomycetota bacterium]|nr:GAF and ANTAR domain-containing protein [Actinomycetota bacterium]